MAFAATKTEQGIAGNKRVVSGTFTGGEPTGAEVDTGLTTVTYASLTGASEITVDGGKITVTSLSVAGFWRVEGY